MPGKQTPLTARLEPCKRQFFQWHLVEKRPLSEVKSRMDQLTEALISAHYSYYFVAEKDSWRSRSRYWNQQAKNAWNIQTNQKGRALAIPTELAKFPVWIEWDQDVWDWRNHKLGGKYPLQSSVIQADRNTGDWNGQYQTFAVTGERDTFQDSHASLSTNSPPYPSDLTINPGTTFPYFNTVTVPWPQQASIPFATLPLPLSPQPGQARDVLQDYDCGSKMYYQNYQTAPSAPDAILPASNSIHGEEHDLVSYMGEMGPSYMSERALSFMSDMQPSHVPVESWPQQDYESAGRDHTAKDGTSSRRDYA